MPRDDCPGSSIRTVLIRSNVDREFYSFIKPWIKRAYVADKSEDYFEAFIYLWVSFNAWLTLTISDRNEDKDSILVQAAGKDAQLSDRFNILREESDIAPIIYEFHELWPIFKVRTLIEKNIGLWGTYGAFESRNSYREKCFGFDLKPNDYAPRCFSKHKDNGYLDHSKVPLDWPHTLSAIYQVRCNLFHGGKIYNYSKDQNFVKMAFIILWSVWVENEKLKNSRYPNRLRSS